MQSKKSFDRNDEVFSLSNNFVTTLSSDSIDLILSSLPSDQYKAFALSYLSFYQLEYNSAISAPWIREALDIATRINDSRLLYWVHRHYGFYHKAINEQEEALRHFILSNEFAKQSNFERGTTINLLHFAELHRLLDNYAKAFEYGYANIEARKNSKPDFGFGFAYYFLGNLFTEIEDYSEAIKNYTQAEAIFKSEGELDYTGVMLNAKATALEKQNLPDSALVFIYEAMEIFQQTNSNYFRGRTFLHLGNIQLSKQNYDLALAHYIQADSFLQSDQHHLIFLETIQKTGYVYLAQQQYNKAEEHFKRYLNHIIDSDTKQFFSIIYNDLSKLYIETGNLIQAKDYAIKARDYARQDRLKEQELIAMQNLLKIHFGLKEYKKAETTQEEISMLSANAQQELQKKNISDLKISYQIKRQRDLLEKENQLVIKDKKWSTRFLWFTLIAFLIVSLLFLQIVFITKKRSKTLAHKNTEIALLNEELEEKVSLRTQDLNEKTQQLNNYFDNLPGVSYRLKCDANFTPVFISKGCVALFGVTPEYILHSQTYRNLIHPEYHDEKIKMSNDFIKKNNTDEILELIYPIKSDGRPKWVVDRSKLLIGDDGESYLHGILLDITDQMIAEAALKISQKELSLIYNNTQDFMGMVRHSKTGEFIFESFNQPYLDFLILAGLLDENRSISGMKMQIFMKDILQLNDDEVAERMGYMKTVFLSKQRVNYETIIPADKYGNKNTYDVMLTPVIEDSKATSDRIIFVMHDITQRVNAEKALIRSEKRLSTIYNNTQDFMGLMQVKLDEEIIIESFNQPYINFLIKAGTLEKGHNLSGMKLSDYFKNIIGIPEQGIAMRIDAIKKACRSKEVISFETAFPIASHLGNVYIITLTPIAEDGKKNFSRIIFVMQDITERRNAELALKKSEKRLSTIYNASQDLIGLIKPNTNGGFEIESFNQPATNFLTSTGVIPSPETVHGIGLEILFEELYGLSKESVAFRMENIEDVFNHNKTFKYESLFAPPGKGLNLYFETIISPILNTEGKCTHALYSARDITESKISKDKIIASEKRLSMIFNGAKDQMFIFNIAPDGTLIFEDANQSFIETWAPVIPNQNIKELYGKDATFFMTETMDFSKEKIDKRLKFVYQLIKDKKSQNYEEVYYSKKLNKNFLFDINATPILNKENVCEKLLFVVRDVTQKVESQQALARSEKQLSTIYNSTNDFIGLIQLQADRNYTIESINRPGIDFLTKSGLISDPQQLIGIELRLLFEKVFGLPDELVQVRMQMVDKVFFEYQTITHQNPLAPAGTDIFMNFETTMSPIINQDGGCTQALYVARDTTESELAKSKIIASQKRLSSIFNGSNDMMAIFDVIEENEFLFENTNDSFKKTWAKVNPNLDLGKIYGKSMKSYLLKIMRFSETEADVRLQICYQIIRDKKPYNYEEAFHAHNNKKYIIDVTISPILDEEDVCKKLLFVLRDVTLKHKAKEQMISKILETEDRERSRFAKELHDSLGQNLTASSLNFNFVKKSMLSFDPDTQKRFSLGFKFLKEAIDESRNIAHNLMPQAISDFGYILSIESLLENLAQTTDIEFSFYDNLNKGRLPVDHELSLYRITQEAINNILKHAEATKVTLQLIKHSNSVILTIEDNGKGFSTEPHTLNSFGLNSMRNRASALSGVLDIDGTPGRGTSITLEIPV